MTTRDDNPPKNRRILDSKLQILIFHPTEKIVISTLDLKPEIKTYGWQGSIPNKQIFARFYFQLGILN